MTLDVHAPRRILVGLDFSAPSLRACDWAVDLAAPLHAMIALVHVVEGGAVLSKAEHAEVHAVSRRRLERIVAKVRPYAREVDAVVVDGSPWAALDEVARDRAADAVVVGTHGRRGLARALVGSVAEHVVRSASVPVLTVPGWSFTARSETGKRLAGALEALGLADASFVALSRSAVPLAATMIERLGGTLDLWATEPLVLPDGTVIGAMGEDERPTLDTDATASAIQRDDAAARARDRLRAEVFALKGSRAVRDLWNRPVVLVADGVFGDAAVRAAADVFARMRPERVVLATPVLSRAAERALAPVVQSAVCLERAVASESCAYRDDILPGDLVARELLEAGRGR